MKIDTIVMLGTIASVGLVLGCATAPPPQLVEARTAYAASERGPAAKLTPTELHEAGLALSKANAEFDQHGDTLQCRDYAYIAKNKVKLADVKARTELDRQRIVEAEKAGVVVRDKQVKTAQSALSSAREQLDEERRDGNAKTERAAEKLAVEKEARSAAEAKLAGAMKDLAAIAAIKEEARGLVITLSGGVLFASNKYKLLGTATTKLDQVAEALKAQDPERRMVVEGHTDSRGSDATNEPLSLNRANVVRDYLVTRGVDGDKIRAVGLGSTRPLVDNRSAENRANNRRVEIVIEPARLSAR